MNIQIFNTVIDSINYFAGFLSLVIVINHLLVKDKTWLNYIIMLLYFCWSIIILSFPFEISGKMAAHPHLIGISWPFYSFVTGALYLYIRILANPSFKPGKKHLLCLVPGVLYAITLVPTVFMLSAREKIHIITAYTDWTIITFINLFFFFVVGSIFFVLGIYEIRFSLKIKGLKKTRSFRMLFILLNIAMAGIILNCIGLITGNALIMRIDSIVFNIVFFTPYILSNRHPDLMHNFSVDLSRAKYKQSQIHGLNIDSIITRLDDLCKIEKVYVDPELTINKLSKRINISSHQLSEILNSRLEINFRNYINNHRVEMAKELLIKKLDESILQIAYIVGFNSKTAFNNAFKKITGINPSDFRSNRKIS